MPTPITIRLDLAGTDADTDTFKVSKATAWALRQCGWAFVRETRWNVFLRPPEDVVPSGRTIDVTMPAPTDDEILAVAKAMHARGEHEAAILHGWPIVYTPAHEHEHTEEQTDGTVEHWTSAVPASVTVGFALIWLVQVAFGDDGEPIITEHHTRQVEQPQLNLFLQPTPTYVEGAADEVLMTVYERNPEARAECIRHHGTRCQVCGIDFGERYGDVGKGFIHVHHLTPLAAIGESYSVDPVADLRPVCPNCHAMLHRTTPPMTLEALAKVLR